MTGEEIKNKIDANNELIEQLTDPTQFVLNKAIVKLMHDNAELSQMCKHEYVDGFCKFCYEKEAQK